jgi:hypothetical protein
MNFNNGHMVLNDGSTGNTGLLDHCPSFPYGFSLFPSETSINSHSNTPGSDYVLMAYEHDLDVTNKYQFSCKNSPPSTTFLHKGVALPLGLGRVEVEKEATRLQLLSQNAVARLSQVQQELNAVTTEINKLAIEQGVILVQKAESAASCVRWACNLRGAFTRLEQLLGQDSGNAAREYDLLKENVELLQNVLFKERLTMRIATQRAQLMVRGMQLSNYEFRLTASQSTNMHYLTLKETELQGKLKQLREEAVR